MKTVTSQNIIDSCVSENWNENVMIKVCRNSMEFIIADRDCKGEVIDPTPVLESLCREIGSIRLGMNYADQYGVWIDDAGEAIREGNLVLRVSFISELWPEIVGVIMRFVALGVLELYQAELAVYVNGTLVISSTGLTSGADAVEGADGSQKIDSVRIRVPSSQNGKNSSAELFPR